jgi:hypothetical protein
MVRFSNFKAIPGTQSYHSFVPYDEFEIEAETYSSSEQSKKFVMKWRTNQQSRGLEFLQLKNDCVIACLYEEDGKWYFAQIFERDEERVEHLSSIIKFSASVWKQTTNDEQISSRIDTFFSNKGIKK